ncbi:MAG: PAS domain-containing protein [Bacteroidetes bacterium]|nr:PAS domain-containing protein [Bacteroidota bacterium]
MRCFKFINRYNMNFMYSQVRWVLLLIWAFSVGSFTKPLGIIQDRELRFKQYTTNEGLSNNWVRTITQDRYGFLWVGTDYGLNRFDGYTFSIYTHKIRDTTSLGSSNIIKVLEDSKGRLWILTRTTLNLYNRKTDAFTSYRFWGNEVLTSIVEDKDGELWVSSSIRLYKFSPEKGIIGSYYSSDIIKGRKNLGPRGIYKLFVSSNNNIWLATGNGLHRYDKKTNTFENYYHDETKPNSLGDDNIYSIEEDNQNRLWIGTASGLDVLTNMFAKSSEATFYHYRYNPKDSKSILPGTVLTLLRDRDDNLWIGLENSGLCKLKLSHYRNGKNNFERYLPDPSSLWKLNAKSVYSIYQDRDGNLWVGTFDGGLHFSNKLFNTFQHIRQNTLLKKNGLCDNHVNVFLEDGDGMWIGTEGGLNYWDRRKNIFKSYIHDPFDERTIGSNAIWALCKDSKGNLWIGTWGGGLNRFNYRTQTFERYKHNPHDTTSISSNNIFSIVEDTRGNLWIGTMGGGLNLFDRKRKIFKKYDIMNSNIYTNYVSAIIEVTPGKLWILAETSVDVFDIEKRVFTHFLNNPSDSTSLSSNKVISIYKDRNDNIWIGTDAGLNLYKRNTNTFRVFNIENGLVDNCINSIVEDDDGNLWLGTNNGLSMFVQGTLVPSQIEFRTYTYEEGLAGNGFNRRACYKDRFGLLYFGGPNGFNVFDPREIKTNNNIPPVVITKFILFNKPITLGEKGYTLHNNEDNTIVLPYKPVFSIEYSALNFTASIKNRYAYKLEGFDVDWNYVDTRRIASYTNLPSGKYVFRVRGSNNDGVWNTEGMSLYIEIQPAVWERWWFQSIVVALLCVTGYSIYRWKERERKLLENKKITEAIAEATTRERNLLRTIIDKIPDEIHIVDLSGKLIVCNRAFMNSVHIANESDAIGKHINLFLRDTAIEIAQQEREEILVQGREVIDVEGTSLVGNEKRWVLRSVLPLREFSGEIIGIIVIEHNITERKKYEEEREKLINELQSALADVRVLSGLLPICANCKKIRNDQGYWVQLEAFIQTHSSTKFTHGLCPECATKLYPEYVNKVKNTSTNQ